MTIKILNLYAGIGGNRKLWSGDIKVTAIEIDPLIANVYKTFFPDDEVIVADAHQYLLEHFKEYDFIWSSPPCPTHSDIRRVRAEMGDLPIVYPDLKLYEEIILLTQFYSGKFVVENVIGYYKPLVEPQQLNRHYFWANFKIAQKRVKGVVIQHFNIPDFEKELGFDLSTFKGLDKRLVLRNCVNPRLGLHIFDCAFREKQQTIGEIQK